MRTNPFATVSNSRPGPQRNANAEKKTFEKLIGLSFLIKGCATRSTLDIYRTNASLIWTVLARQSIQPNEAQLRVPLQMQWIAQTLAERMRRQRTSLTTHSTT